MKATQDIAALAERLRRRGVQENDADLLAGGLYLRMLGAIIGGGQDDGAPQLPLPPPPSGLRLIVSRKNP